MNRLAGSASLYLRQHASDPVAWWPWCDEAFAEASARDVPVLLSCGYSACHWCHVMQRESFADPGTAALIGDRFVAVKVDRGQRPDIDALYTDYVTATTGHGGWPMTVFLTPSRLPLLGGTYFPREPAGRLPAFGDVLAEVARAYAEDRGRLERTSADSLEFLREMAAPKRAGTIDARLATGAADAVLQASDAAHGGFGEGAKFPRFSLLLFLTAFARLQGDREAAFVTRNALVTMLRGGIHDHVGGGIFRYTVDREWAVPHFEKMLCDNAMLLRTLATAHATEPSEEFALAAARTVAWLEREMRLGNGAFATALAAESGGIEGASYTWTRTELEGSLDAHGLALAESALGVTGDGALPGGANVLTRRGGRADDAAAVDALLDRLAGLRAARPRPERDEAAIVSHNALAARGLIEAGAAFGDAAMTARGVGLVRLLIDATRDGVVHVLGDPEVSGVRLAEDHAHLAAAALTAYESAGDAVLLAEARRLQAETEARFVADGAVWMTPADTDLPVRPRESSDDPLPSGASTFVETAVRLAVLDGDEAAAERADELLRGWWAAADYAPQSAGTALEVMTERVWGPSR